MSSYIPTLGGSPDGPFELQFPMSPVSSISRCTTLIKMLANDDTDAVISHASGFLWRHNKHPYLITARHVLTGREPFSDEIMGSNGYIPRRFTIYPKYDMGGQHIGVTTVTIDAPENGRFYLQDPEFSSLKTDIAILPLPLMNGFPFEKVFCINDSDLILKFNIFTQIGSEFTVVGYPNSNFGEGMFPIWRIGTIASEPRMPIDNKPMFLLDIATAQGFSGAPVFRRHSGALPVQNTDGSMSLDNSIINAITLAGVYSGRIRHSHVGGEIPFVFYANRIPIIFSSLDA